MFNFSSLHLAEKNPKSVFIKDPIHESINFFENQYWLYRLVNTYEFQRLNRIRQLALTFFNFPSSTHTRYTHSLGVYELCNRFIKHFLEKGYLDLHEDKYAINVALATSLLHDIGHGPLSHAFESTVCSFSHENMSIRIISSKETKINRILRDKALEDRLPEDFYVNEIVKVFNKTTEYKWIVDLISSEIDIDRLDFIVRDSYYSGVSFGKTIDISLLIKWSIIKNNRFLFVVKAKNHLEHFLLVRSHMYEDLYLNKSSCVYEDLIANIFAFIKNHKNLCLECKSFKKISFLFDPVENWSLDLFLGLYDDKFLDIVLDILRFINSSESLNYIKTFFGFSNSLTMNEYIETNNITFKFFNRDDHKLSLKLFDFESDSIVNVDI